ncbi:hypothetical protein Btru_064095 [Bulinus truncatus]|nr:hypothetical protein Btru_064095 [Bulinus truncatus]
MFTHFLAVSGRVIKKNNMFVTHQKKLLLFLLIMYDLETQVNSTNVEVENREVELKDTDRNNNSVYYKFQDAFNCPPCMCYRSEDNIITADCANRRYESVPIGLPVAIRALLMTHNKHLHQFNTAGVSIYSLMTSLIVHSNSRLTEIVHEATVNMSSQLTRLDLSHNRIRYIQTGSFRYLGNLQELFLGANQLANISADMFEGLQNLKILNLSGNSISHIDNNMFDIFESLQSLDLSRNQFSFTIRSIPLNSFEKLVNLQKLYLQGNVLNSQPYPNKALSKLSNLTHLYLDVNRYSKFGPEIKSLKKLKFLAFGGLQGNCYMKNVTEDLLEHTPHLTAFIIVGCRLVHIDPSVYANVKNLETLEISQASESYDLYDALDHLRGLVNSSVKTLRLISLTHTVYLCRALRKEHAKYLQHIALEELNLSQNKIALVQGDFTALLPKTLKRLVLMDNRLSIQEFTLPGLRHLQGLIEIHLDRQNYNLRMETPASTDLFQVNRLYAPPNLKIVRGSNFSSFDSYMLEVQWKFNNSLREITFHNNFLVQWGEGTLPPLIEQADLSNNFARTLSSHFFRPNNSLVSLNISNNILGECFASDFDGHIFSRPSKLIFLDISMNLITTLHRPFFSGLVNLEILLAPNNKLQILNVSLRHMSSLRFMNFSQNSITWIDQSTRDDLDILASTHTVHLDLSYNPLPCTCEGLPILQWMAYTNVNLVNQVYLRCQSEGGTMSDFGDLDARVTQVQRLCASRAIILVISISFSVVIVIFTALALVYRFRWKIRYLRNIALARFVGFKPKNVFGNNFLYDAYILYDDRAVNFVFRDCIQELEVKRGHRLLLADRDIMPGSIMTSAILSAVQNSYRTIPMVTPDFYDAVYSEYAVKMAVMEEIYGQRQILHLCLHQPTDPEEMSKDLLSIMHRNHYTEYPPEPDRTEDLVEHFWDQLSGCIQQMN